MSIVFKIILVVFLSLSIQHFYYYSYIYAKYWHLIMDHKLLDAEQLLTKNAVMKKAKTYVYNLDYKYFNIYGIKLYFPFNTVKNDIFSTNESDFVGKFHVELLHNTKVIREKIVTRPNSVISWPDVYDSEGNYLHHSNFIKYIQLDSFSLPYEGIYGSLKLRVTILEEDPILIKEKIDIYLGISAP